MAKTLRLNKETLTALTADELSAVGGGDSVTKLWGLLIDLGGFSLNIGCETSGWWCSSEVVPQD